MYDQLLQPNNKNINRPVFFKVLFIYFLERREGEREGEKHQCVIASQVVLTGDRARNPGMCSHWESNQRPLGSQPVLNLLSYTSQGNSPVLKRARSFKILYKRIRPDG